MIWRIKYVCGTFSTVFFGNRWCLNNVIVEDTGLVDGTNSILQPHPLKNATILQKFFLLLFDKTKKDEVIADDTESRWWCC